MSTYFHLDSLTEQRSAVRVDGAHSADCATLCVPWFGLASALGPKKLKVSQVISYDDMGLRKAKPDKYKRIKSSCQKFHAQLGLV